MLLFIWCLMKMRIVGMSSQKWKLVFEISLVNSLCLLLSPGFALVLVTIWIARLTINVILKIKFQGKVELMGGSDAFWATESYAHANVSTGILGMKGKCEIERIRRHILEELVCYSRVGERHGYRLLRRIVKKLGFFCWEKVDDFNVAEHVKFLNRDCMNTPYNERDILNVLETSYDFVATLTTGSERPPWEILVVPHFQSDNNISISYALVARWNHGIGDGLSVLMNTFSVNVQDLFVNKRHGSTHFKIPWLIKVVYYMKVMIFGPRQVMKDVFHKERNCFHSGKLLTGPKKLAVSHSFPFNNIKSISVRNKTTITAILITAISGALKRLALERRWKVPGSIQAGITFTMMPSSGNTNLDLINKFSIARFPVELGIQDLEQRLASAKRSADSLRESQETVVNYFIICLIGLLPECFISTFINMMQATFIFTNIPGGSIKKCTLGGGYVEDLMGWNVIKGSTGLGFCMVSYAGKVRVAVVADKVALPGANDAQDLILAFEKELAEMTRNDETEEKAKP